MDFQQELISYNNEFTVWMCSMDLFIEEELPGKPNHQGSNVGYTM